MTGREIILPNVDEARDALDPTEAPEPGVDEKEVPCEFHFRSGKVFIVPKVAAWCYIPQGIFATGHFKGYSGEQHIIINADELEYQVLDFNALAKFNEREAASDLT